MSGQPRGHFVRGFRMVYSCSIPNLQCTAVANSRGNTADITLFIQIIMHELVLTQKNDSTDNRETTASRDSTEVPLQNGQLTCRTLEAQ